MTNQPYDHTTTRPETDVPPWYVIQTRPRRELLVASQLERADVTNFLPEVLQQRATGTQPLPLFPGYLFVQVDLRSSAAGRLIHTPGVIRLVGSDRQPTPVAATTVEALQARVAQVNAKGGLAPHNFQVGDALIFTAGPLQGLEAIFIGPLTPSQRVQVLLHFLGQQQQVEVDVRLLEKNSNPRQPQGAHPPRRSRGKGRPLAAAQTGAHPGAVHAQRDH